MEPPQTPEEQALLEQAIADMLEGREAAPHWSGTTEFFARMGCVLRPTAALPEDPTEWRDAE